eukprot:6271344-Pyramimonas_sp.AAC.1
MFNQFPEIFARPWPAGPANFWDAVLKFDGGNMALGEDQRRKRYPCPTLPWFPRFGASWEALVATARFASTS